MGIMPSPTGYTLKRELLSALPFALRCDSPLLVPLQVEDIVPGGIDSNSASVGSNDKSQYGNREPLSAAACRRVGGIIDKSYQQLKRQSSHDMASVMEDDDVYGMVGRLQRACSEELLGVLSKAYKDFNDAIPYGNQSCKDWLTSSGFM